MKLNELYADNDYNFECVECLLLAPLSGDRKDELSGLNAHIELSAGGAFALITSKGRSSFSIKSRNADIIKDLIHRGFSNVCYVYNPVSENNEVKKFFLDITFFSQSTKFGTFNIVLSEHVKNSLIRKGQEPNYDILALEFMFSNGFEQCFAFSDGTESVPHTDPFITNTTSDELEDEVKPKPAAETSDESAENDEGTEDPAISADENEDPGESAGNDENTVKEAQSKQQEPSFETKVLKIYGKNCVLLVRMSVSGENSYFIAEKVVRSRNNRPCMRLGFGKITINSEDKFISTEVKRILSESPGYIKLWDEYSRLEGDFLLDYARKVGRIKVNPNTANIKNGNAVVFVDDQHSIEALRLLNVGDVLEGGSEPEYLLNPDMTWEEYQTLQKENRAKNVIKKETPVYKIAGIEGNSLMLEGTEIPSGSLRISILGDEIQIKRREEARAKISSGLSANPQLGLIIDGKSVRSPESFKPIPPLSDYTMQKLFSKNPPTETQKKAIEIALNTPDIAIIQGPPGTGKTTVIKAIIERLNEISDKRSYSAGEVLVTSSQHDAVYNVINSLDINGMPTIKFGKRSKDPEDAIEKWEHGIDEWCDRVKSDLLTKNPQLALSIEQSELSKQCDFYKMSPGDERAAELLNSALKYSKNANLSARIEELIAEISGDSGLGSKSVDIISMVRRLRVSPVGFADDGADNALALYDELQTNDLFDKKDQNNREIMDTLAEASDFMDSVPEKALLKRLRKVRDELLMRCIPAPFYSIPTVRDDVVNIVTETINTMMSSDNEKDKILRDLYNEVKNKSDGVKAAVRAYSFVFASTVQHSAGGEVTRAKKGGNGLKALEYETVIVDEAARVPPGDLMIPLSQAKRRIILVGDHRQLPHIYDEEIFEAMSEDDAIENEDDIKISMFQHLMESAKKLEQADGIRRTITLDQQYRTHQLLGNFVSRMFYRPYGEDYESPLGDEKFKQPISSKPLIWVDIDRSKGTDRKNGTSRYRDAEAKYISEKLRKYLNDDACRDMTFGVITFYSAQVRTIKSMLDKDILEDHRVLIGSIDSFQGMEFDVVFLSVVRTSGKIPEIDDEEEFDRDIGGMDPNSPDVKKHKQYIETVGRRYYGFLTSENRLCVALSRQKRLLIVVGDSGIFRDSYRRIAEKCVPAMVQLYALAKIEGEVINE